MTTIKEHIKRHYAVSGPPEDNLRYDAAGNIITLADQHKKVQCTTCDDKGFVRRRVPRDHQDFGKAVPCPNPECGVTRDNRMRKVSRLMESSGIEVGYRDFSFSSWDMLPINHRRGKLTARYALEYYTQQRGAPFALSELWQAFPAGELRTECKRRYRTETAIKRGLVLGGINGTSKTGLAAAAAMKLARDGYPVIFTNTLELLSRIFRSYDGSESTDKLVHDVKTVEHLFLDEMTFEAKDSHRRHLQEITRFRYDRDLPMIFTTNLTPNQFEGWFGAQTATGIFGACHWIELGGEVIRHEIDDSVTTGEAF